MSREHNWADNFTFTAQRVHRPDSIDAVRRIVAGTTRAHAIGARHSFNGVADTPGDLIDLRGLPATFSIDRERRTVTAPAGTTHGEMAVHLHGQGWALLNMPSLPHVTIAGAAATGTHGSGDARGTLSADVAALEFVVASGDLITVRRGDPDFEGMVVNLGALGIVTRVTLDIQPTFQMRQDAFEGLTWERVEADLDAIMSSGYSVSLLTMWSGVAIDRLWIKTALVEGTTPAVSGDPFGARPATNAVRQEVPGIHPFGVAGPWLERLPHFMVGVEPGLVGHLQSEYLVPRRRVREAIAALRNIGERIDRTLLITEIRSMTADRLWLSPAHDEPTIGLHFSWQRELEAVAAITAEIEALLLPLGGRPHWGKIMHSTQAQLEPVYPRLQAFRDLVRRFDPDGKFANDFLRRHVLGAA